MFKIYGGGTEFQQWEQGKMLTNEHMAAGDRVIFRNAGGKTIPVDARTEGDTVVVDVPNELLANSANFIVDLAGRHSCRTSFKVVKRDRPADYKPVNNEHRLSATAPDWNQNDPTAPDFVKNRPFYTGDPVEMVLYEKTANNPFDLQNVEESFTVEGLEIGKEYIVSVLGKTYKCVAYAGWDDPVVVALGSKTMLDGLAPEDGEEPFSFFTVTGYNEIGLQVDVAQFIETLDTTEFVFSISGVVEVSHVIDSKYLPAASNTIRGVMSKSEVKASVVPGEPGTLMVGDAPFGIHTYGKLIEWLSSSAIPIVGCDAFGLGGNDMNFAVFNWYQQAENGYRTVVMPGVDFIYGYAGKLRARFKENADGTMSDDSVLETLNCSAPESMMLESSTSGSEKKFKITVDDSGTITATELTE